MIPPVGRKLYGQGPLQKQGLDAANPMLDGALYKELQYSHACRLVNRAVVLEPGVAPMVLEAYELLAPRESHGSLWMYGSGVGGVGPAMPVGQQGPMCPISHVHITTIIPPTYHHSISTYH